MRYSVSPRPSNGFCLVRPGDRVNGCSSTNGRNGHALPEPGIIGNSRALRDVLETVACVADSSATVLLTGETGTGKELIAEAIHAESGRQQQPLVHVNCAALPADLIESELFGHERGAFTGAVARRIGRFEAAGGGTILLDEVAELPLTLQAKLLRVLQEGELERVGGTGTVRVDVRTIAATNRDLETEIAEGRFRTDLYYRLNVVRIHVPPLRERRDDIPALAEYFALRSAARANRRIEGIPKKMLEVLLDHTWPGNVRELQNVIERSVILSRGQTLELFGWESPAGPARKRLGIATLKEHEREHILRVLQLTGWRVSGDQGAAKLLDIKPTTLESRMKRLGIRRPLAAAT